MIRFGPGGNSEGFYESGYKSSVDMPKWLSEMGLSAYEYECTNGVRIGKETAEKIGQQAALYNIALSIHAPYFINLASQEVEKQKNSIRHIIESCRAAKWMGAERVVIHTGSCAKINRDLAMKTALGAFQNALNELKNERLDDIIVCPENLGKINQLGTLDEILEFCQIDEMVLPTIDFGHLYAREMGNVKTVKDFEEIIKKIINVIGLERSKRMHCHFSRVEYTKSGEKRHLMLEETEYGPEFEYLAEVLIKYNLEPIIICESRKYMAEDALKLKIIYETVRAKS